MKQIDSLNDISSNEEVISLIQELIELQNKIFSLDDKALINLALYQLNETND